MSRSTRSLRTAFALGIAQNTAGARKYWYAALVLLPAIYAALWLVVAGSSADAGVFFAESLLHEFQFHILFPLLAVLVGVSALGSERQNQTLPYLLLRPIPRSSLYLARLASSLVFTIGLAWASIALSASVLALFRPGTFGPEEFRRMGAALAVAVPALLSLVAVSTMIGATIPAPLPVGLAYGLLWEGILSSVALGLSRYTAVNAARRLVVEVAPDPTLALSLDLLPGTAGLAGLSLALGTTVATVLGVFLFSRSNVRK